MTAADKIAVSSMIVAVLAFITTLWQAYISRQHNILSVQPIIEHSYALDFQDVVILSIMNPGLGPAIVFELLFRDPRSNLTITTTQLIEIFEASMKGGQFQFEANNIGHTTILRPGETLQIFGMRRMNSDKSTFASAARQFDSYILEIKYRSIYGNTFRYHQPTRVA